MTQDVQPLTWSRRTNLEEHQQFFSKINEIIANLAPTVDEAEAAIAQATQAITNANAAIATANAASAAASAAATQAQTAASTVAGYDTRLTTAEGDIDALQVADQTITGNVAALGTRMTAAESKNSQQDTDITALQTADANNVKITGTHAIGNYAVLLTDNQDMRGIKRHIIGDINTGIIGIVAPASSTGGTLGVAFDFFENTTRVGYMYIRKNSDNSYQLILGTRNSDGTFTERVL